ncbi:hypothetical protein OOK27_40770 [Streptomyces canus]|uniref:hypothetical protein n=1 Tax=Streptomyces canus TaxID=58343 RepID=UPI00224E0487|nr:hypothetical protein [Streptomyces canus]MCX5260411.1 hypothetical protein [Streptomyces canus]
MPDNVARIIAGASAAFTASSMAISYATYHRVRPQLKVKATFGVVMTIKPEGDMVSPSLTIQVHNHGQTAVSLVRAHVQFRDSYYKLLRKRLSGGGHSSQTWLPQLPDGATKDIGPFGGVRWFVRLTGNDVKILERGATHIRVGVELASGIAVYGRWHRKPSWLPSSRSLGGVDGQLSFDDPDSEAAT